MSGLEIEIGYEGWYVGFGLLIVCGFFGGGN